MRKTVCVCALALWFGAAISGQDMATLSGGVTDASDAAVPGAQLTLANLRSAAVYSVNTNQHGVFVFDSVRPDDYRLTVSKQGFTMLVVDRVELRVRERQSVVLRLTAAAPAQQVNTTPGRGEPITMDTSTPYVVGQRDFRNLPLNGHDTESLLALAPGVISPADVRGGTNDVSVNGQRSTANTYTLDNVPLAWPIAAWTNGAAQAAAGVDPTMAISSDAAAQAGGAATFAPIPLDDIQDVRVQTTSYAVEFGSSPGAQVSILSRSGGVNFHGSAYGYVRPSSLTANQWFANQAGLPRLDTSQNRYGATVGGPIARSTFFFFSYEGLNLQSPDTWNGPVPDVATRQSAIASEQPYLNAFPLPNGASIGNGASLYTAEFINPLKTQTGSLRLDHDFARNRTVFFRYSYTRADGSARADGMNLPNMLTSSNSNFQSLTAGLVSRPNSSAVNDLRASYSLFRTDSSSTMDSLGGSIPLDASSLFPPGITAANGSFDVLAYGLGEYGMGERSKYHQDQLNLTDTITMLAGTHQYKFGVATSRIMPTMYQTPYTAQVIFNGLFPNVAGSLLSGSANNALVSTNMPEVYPLYYNLSAFGQDTWTIIPDLTVTIGVRWDVDPAPEVRSGPRPLSQTGNVVGPLTSNNPVYDTQWLNVAPRFGVAYRLFDTPDHETVLRAGAGLFYDVSYGAVNNIFTGAPYSSKSVLISPAIPLTTANLAAPALNAFPYGWVSTTDNNLATPRVLEYSVTIDHNFGKNQLFSLGYVSNSGTNLSTYQMSAPSSTGYYDFYSNISSGPTSKYRGVQAQFRRRFLSGLQVQASYTYSHATDEISNAVPLPGAFGTIANFVLADSDFDVRHNVTTAGSYGIPSGGPRALRALISDWYIDWNATWRTGIPFNITGVTPFTLDGSTDTPYAIVNPEYLSSFPLYFSDPGAPGGRVLNPAAFGLVPAYEPGDLGRNTLRGFGAWQVDAAIRRQIRLSENVNVQLSARAYNIFNHPSFANPSAAMGANFSSPAFGYITQTLNQISGDATSSYAMGGARTMEFTLRLQF